VKVTLTDLRRQEVARQQGIRRIDHILPNEADPLEAERILQAACIFGFAIIVYAFASHRDELFSV
jgi:hypothetical protein